MQIAFAPSFHLQREYRTHSYDTVPVLPQLLLAKDTQKSGCRSKVTMTFFAFSFARFLVQKSG